MNIPLTLNDVRILFELVNQEIECLTEVEGEEVRLMLLKTIRDSLKAAQ